jgi:hypothetical protein
LRTAFSVFQAFQGANMNIFRFAMIGSLLFGLSLFASPAEAFCAGDNGWKAKWANITVASSTSVSASAAVEIDHATDHPSCYGEMKVRAQVSNLSCFGTWSVTVHNGFDSTDSAMGFASCPASCGPATISGGGEAMWNESDNNDFWDSNSIRVPCDCGPPSGGCTGEGCIWDIYECACAACCPLVIDTSGRGYKMTSADRGVWFDINADGQADAISWTDPRRDVAFLTFDRNGNGAIDDGEELFGNVTPVPGTTPPARAVHGFDALASLEHPSYGASRVDGRIDARDAAYQKLLLWTDRNHDGLSQPPELKKASDEGLVSIETRYRESKRVDQHGNEFKLRGIAWWQRGPRLDARIFYDVYFVPQR